MTDPPDLPPEFQRLADLLSRQPPAVRHTCVLRKRDLFRYCLVLALIDDEKARVIGTRIENEEEWLTIETADEVFEMLRPAISEEIEDELLERVRAIADEDAKDA
jgi:hypothetical protein